jgi:hypothetical protein
MAINFSIISYEKQHVPEIAPILYSIKISLFHLFNTKKININNINLCDASNNKFLKKCEWHAIIYWLPFPPFTLTLTLITARNRRRRALKNNFLMAL